MLETIVNALAAYKEIAPSTITAETAFKDLGLDSLDIVEITMDLEDKLGVTIEMKPEITTVGQFADYVASLKKDA